MGINDRSSLSRNRSKTLHTSRGRSQKRTNKATASTQRPESVAPATSRLGLLEQVLATQSTRSGTPFHQITAISNPGTSLITGYPALQWWFESFRTIKTDAIHGVLRLQQELLVGSLILSNKSLEADARQECYSLLEEVEDRVLGYMPQVAGTTADVILPMQESDAAFSAMEQGGLFVLSIMWTFQWIITKGVKP